jgi:hypothetical protein
VEVAAFDAADVLTLPMVGVTVIRTVLVEVEADVGRMVFVTVTVTVKRPWPADKLILEHGKDEVINCTRCARLRIDVKERREGRGCSLMPEPMKLHWDSLMLVSRRP